MLPRKCLELCYDYCCDGSYCLPVREILVVIEVGNETGRKFQ